MKISLITVCYNSEKTIRETLESVLNQTYENYEYLIIDGLSSDSTLNIIKSYESKFNGKLKFISEKDKGLYDAMNKGISLAKGDIIGILNSDDILANDNVFEKIVDSFDNEIDGIYSDLLFMDEETMSKKTRVFKAGKYTKKFGWHPPHPTLYLKKEIYEKHGNFNLNYKIAADLDFMLRIINSGVKLKYLNCNLVYMRSGGVSTNGLRGYYKSFNESLIILKNNKVKFAFFSNIYRTMKTFVQVIRAKLSN